MERLTRSLFSAIRNLRPAARPSPLGELVNELGALRTELAALHARHLRDGDSLAELVAFFAAVAPLQDRDVTSGALAALRGKRGGEDLCRTLERVRARLESAGRNPYGWNRTRPGEAVTDGRVFLGNGGGAATHNVACWRRQREDGWAPGRPGRSPYQTVEAQARAFLESHLPPLLEAVETLERGLSPTADQPTSTAA